MEFNVEFLVSVMIHNWILDFIWKQNYWEWGLLLVDCE